jgi:hypothetical protein
MGLSISTNFLLYLIIPNGFMYIHMCVHRHFLHQGSMLRLLISAIFPKNWRFFSETNVIDWIFAKTSSTYIVSAKNGNFFAPYFSVKPFLKIVTSVPDIDECSDRSACGREAACQNTAGSYKCSCFNGSPFEATTRWLACQKLQILIYKYL